VIPHCIDVGGPWNVLPPGVHNATFKEIRSCYGISEHRLRLCDGLEAGLRILVAAGCKEFYIDGSFVTEKAIPNDFDVCWVYTPTIAVDKIDSVLLDFSNMRAHQKERFFGEFFPISLNTHPMLEFFQTDKYTGRKKGIIALDSDDLD
jgi:hypothetical protein